MDQIRNTMVANYVIKEIIRNLSEESHETFRIRGEKASNEQRSKNNNHLIIMDQYIGKETQ